ncbi:MAG: glycosyltransferase 87 family protein, partial [Scytonema sp. PMC 1070.18]|nr:glycosyltransferase 87 family protein [Scytonema sp. PMC 1070.18]
LLFVSSNFWRIHTDVGQIYIFYILSLSLSYGLLQKENSVKKFLAGCLIGLTASLRFPIILMTIPMIIFKEFKILGATIFSFCLCLSASVWMAGKQAWMSYFSAMQTIGKLNIGKISLSTNTENIVLPKTIEGIRNLTGMYGILQYDSSLQSNLKKYLNFTLSTNYLLLSIFLILLVYAGTVYFLYTKKMSNDKNVSLDMIFMTGTLMILIAELLLPAPRYSYSDIQLLIPFLLIVKNLDFSNDITLLSFGCLLICLFLTIGLFSWLPYGMLLGEYAIVIIMMVMSLVLHSRNRNISI